MSLIILPNKFLYIQELSLEITQRCNLDCRHCLKGDARNVCMSEEILDAVFSQIPIIGGIFLSGGEPFLAPHVIKMLIDKIKKYKVIFFQWAIYTNGTIYSDEIVELLKELDSLRVKDSSIKAKSFIGISGDEYHYEAISKQKNKELIYKENRIKVASTPWFKDIKRLPNQLCNEGRAVNIPITERAKYEFKPMNSVIATVGEKIFFGPNFFVNANGIITFCDVSYDNQESKYNLGNIKERPLMDCMLSHPIISCNSLRDFDRMTAKELAKYESGVNFVKCKR